MKLYINQLNDHLKKGFASSYLVTSDEILLRQRACDTIRKHAMEAGYERRRFIIDDGFNWDSLERALSHLSLFTPRQLIDIQCQTIRFGKQGSALITQWVKHPSSDTLLLISGKRLTPEQQRLGWVKSIIQQGIFLPIWPLDAHQFHSWLTQESLRIGIKLTPEALNQLATRTEGHLLAAAQALETLALNQEEIDKNKSITESMVERIIQPSNRFNVYQLFDAIALSQIQRIGSILDELMAEGVEPMLVLWALCQELRLLIALKPLHVTPSAFNEYINKDFRLKKRKPAILALLKRCTLNQLYRWLSEAAHVDELIKSKGSNKAWDYFRQCALSMGRL